MATLQKIRNRAGLLIIVIGVALLAFIIGDGLRSGSTVAQQRKQNALTINGEKVKIEDYSQRLSEITRMYEQQGRQLDDAQRMQINNQLAQEFIQNEALKKITKQTGLVVTPKELFALVMGDGVQQHPIAAQNLGTDPEQIKDFLRQLDESQIKALPQEQQAAAYEAKAQLDALYKSISSERLLQKYTSLIARTYAVNKVDEKFMSGAPTRTVAVVRTPSTLLKDPTIEVSDKEVADYYAQHIENYRLPFPYTLVDYIAAEVLPSEADNAASKAEMEKAREALLNTAHPETVVRNYDNGFAPDMYLTGDEISSMNISVLVNSYIQVAGIGDVNRPFAENGRYNLVKIVDKKQAPKDLTARVIVLDSINFKLADSIATAINAGSTSFAEMVNRYSIDPTTKAQEGFFTFQDNNGMLSRNLTEPMLSRSGLDTLMQVAPNKAFVFNQGANKLILQVASFGENVPKFKIAFCSIPATYSDETYNEKYRLMSDILAENKSFDSMKEAAKKAGFEVSEGVKTSASEAQLGSIGQSREVVSWALRGKEGEVSEHVFRCGTSHLVIARIGKTIPAGHLPIEEVKQSITDKLIAEKRGEQLATQLAEKSYKTMGEYAQAMQTQIDTLSSVSNISELSSAPRLSAYAMTLPLGTISKPFPSTTEVIVVQPIAENSVTVVNSNIEQQRRSIGQGLGWRAFRSVMDNMKVVDNRGRFY